MFTLCMEVVNSSQSVGFTKCRIIPSIYWMTHVGVQKNESFEITVCIQIFKFLI